MKILGIDPGFGRLGYAVIEKDEESPQIRVIDCSCLETSKNLDYYGRLLAIAEKIKKIILKHKPKIMAIEKIFFTKNQKTAMQIAEVRGILMYLAILHNITVKEYTPLEVKIALCGYGKAEKEQVQKMLKTILKIRSLPKIDDATDALAIAITCISCIHSYKIDSSLS